MLHLLTARMCPIALALLLPAAASASDILVCAWNSHNVERCGPWVPGQSGGLRNAHAMTFDPDGDLLVASVGTNQVLKYDGSSGDFLSVFIDANNNGGLSGPTDIRYGPGGDLYVTSFNTAQVLRYDGASGAFVGELIGPPDNDGLAGPEKIRFRSGRAYVLSGPQNRVLAFDENTGAFIGEYISAAGSGLADPHNFVFGDDGFVYITSFNNNRVVRFNESDGSFDQVLITALLSLPHGINLEPDGGPIIVTNFGSDTVNRYDRGSGDYIDTIVNSNVDAPTDVIFAPPADVIEVCPDAFTRLRGLPVAGDLSSLCDDDDDRLSTRPDVLAASLEPPVQIEVSGTLPTDAPSALSLAVQSHGSEPNAILQRVLFYNFEKDLYEFADLRLIETTDRELLLVADGDVTRYVQPGAGTVRALIQYLQQGPSIPPTWHARIDMVRWIAEE